jgi:hypothetical protein
MLNERALTGVHIEGRMVPGPLEHVQDGQILSTSSSGTTVMVSSWSPRHASLKVQVSISITGTSLTLTCLLSRLLSAVLSIRLGNNNSFITFDSPWGPHRP